MICPEAHNKKLDSMAGCGCMIVKCTICSFWEVFKDCEDCAALKIEDGAEE